MGIQYFLLMNIGIGISPQKFLGSCFKALERTETSFKLLFLLPSNALVDFCDSSIRTSGLFL